MTDQLCEYLNDPIGFVTLTGDCPVMMLLLIMSVLCFFYAEKVL
ncbi:hypothetical protein [Halomonas caseinilytica]|nr:hypothetical protein [Halomonas caseinilytica]